MINLIPGGFNPIRQRGILSGQCVDRQWRDLMGEIEPELPKRRPKTAIVLYMLSTWLYIFFVGFLIMIFLEVWKGIELLAFINDYWFSFGGVREVVATAIICLVAGRILDVYAKRLNPRLKNTWRGWHYPE
jgi:hypothetical protein